MLHPSKSQAILQWFNALTTKVDVQSLSQFADGTHFCDIVNSVKLEVVKEIQKDNAKRKDDVKQKDGAGEKDYSSPIEKGTETVDYNSFTIPEKYHVIKQFIDAYVQIKSINLIVYSDCIEGKEVELAKVAVVLLSGMTQSYLSTDNERLSTMTLLDPGVQEDILECVSLFTERGDKEGSLIIAELHKILGRAAKYKATPRRKTPHRGNPETVESSAPRKRRGARASAIIYEDMAESPLKEILQSPNNSRHRIAIDKFKKESELSKWRNAFHAEEEKVHELSTEKTSISEELTKKKEELEKLKTEFREYCTTAEERESHASRENASLMEQLKKLNKEFGEQKEEMKLLKTENEKLNNVIDSDREKKLQSKNLPQDPGDRDLVVNAMKQVNEMHQKLESKDLELQECKKRVEILDENINTYKQIFEELRNKRESPMVTPTRVSEVASDILNADVMEKLKEKEQEVEKARELARNLKNQLKINQQKFQQNSDNLKAALDKTSSLQEKYESLLNLTQSCPACGNVSKGQSEDLEALSDNSGPNSSGQFGILWGAASRENVPRTRSGTTSEARTLEMLKTSCRTFCKRLIKWKIADDEDTKFMQQIDAQTRKLVTIDDVLMTFDHILLVLKKAESFVVDMKDFKEAAKVEIEKLKTTQGEAKQEISELKSGKDYWEKKCTAMQKNAKIYKAMYTKMEEKCRSHLQQIQDLRNSSCASCEKLRKKLTEAKKDLQDAQRAEEEFNCTKKELEDKIKAFRKQAEYLLEEKKVLLQNQRDNSLGSTTARNAMIRRFQQLGKEEEERKRKEEAKRMKEAQEIEEQRQPVVNVNTYIVHHPEKGNFNNESFVSNQFGNRSIKSVYLQTEDEEDFLNHSSLSQIQNGVYDPEAPENRLHELQRRNTLCPPHLQSSYPLEIQDMTPSERKYSMAPRFSEAERGYQSRREEEPGPSTLRARVMKRKVSEVVTTQPKASKGRVVGSNRPSFVKTNRRTPIKQTIGKSKTFKTPSSIRRLIGIQS